MQYKFTIGGKSVESNFSGGCGYPICDVSMIMSDSDIAPGIPLDKDGNPPPSGKVFENTEDTDEYTWYPFPFHIYDLRGTGDSKYPRRNICEDIMNGELTKDNINSFSNIRPSAKSYIKANYDWYVSTIITELVEGICANYKLSDEINKRILKYFLDKGAAIFKMSKEELFADAESFVKSIKAEQSRPPRQKPSQVTPPESKADDNKSASPTAQVIQNLVGTSQPSVRNLGKPLVDQGQNDGVTVNNGDGTFTVNFSNLPTQPEAPATTAQVQETTVPLVTAPAGTPNTPVMVPTPVTPPPVGAAPKETVAPTTRTTKAKSDVVDNPPQTIIVPEASKVDPLIDVQETESDKLLAKYPQLQLYKKCVGDQFNCEFFLNGKLVSVRVRDKNAIVNDPDIVTLGATFDVAGAIISPETNKFWAGNDPDIIYDFELPLKLTEDVVRAYLNDEEFNEDMYYSNSSVCELNKQFNIRSIWEFVSDGEQATQTMQHLKKVFGLPKFKQVRKKLTGRRLSMDSFIDPTHFILVTHPGTPDYLGGTKVNEGKTIFKLTVNGDDMKLEPVKDAA